MQYTGHSFLTEKLLNTAPGFGYGGHGNAGKGSGHPEDDEHQ